MKTHSRIKHTNCHRSSLSRNGFNWQLIVNSVIRRML